MSQSVWGYWLIALGIGVITVMMLVQNYTTINQEDYYLLKEVTQAAMNDAIDYNHYRQYGELKINREKFVENFERRFAESVKGNKNYQTDFYAIYETPPKVSVKVSTKTSSFNVSGDTMDLDVTNSIDAILENNSTNTVTKIYYSVPYSDCVDNKQDYLGYCKIINNPTLNETGIIGDILNVVHKVHKKTNVTENDINLISAKYIGPMTSENDYNNYLSQFDETYGNYNNYVHANKDALGKTFTQLTANEIVDIKLTVTNNKLYWSGKFKCNGTQGYSEGSTNTQGGSIANNCLIGIKYELKFSYTE